eukprot:TRINITY_DN63027_c0_g1_i1.p1 TRINITY_DN63027_c0_g1~~TRINITY_DN63027_c0_g1_i1.p1  ORF type:complete len:1172 (+),score=85.89 TRINITY_DN63027_c0_g1_i1:207-3518(+)
MTILCTQEQHVSDALLNLSGFWLEYNSAFDTERSCLLPCKGSIVLLFKDHDERTFVCTTQRDISDGIWHHLLLSCSGCSVDTLQLVLDGREMDLQCLVDTGPDFTYTPMGRRVYVGAHRGSRGIANPFQGYMKDVLLWSAVDRSKVLLNWVLDDGKGTKAVDISGNKHDGLIQKGTWRAVRFPSAGLHFDGRRSYVDLGPLPGLGPRLTNFKIDISFMTAEVHEPMALLKVVDSGASEEEGDTSQMVLCIELNRSMQNLDRHEGLQFEANSVLFYLRDRSNNVLECCLKETITDNAWHNIVWEVTDATTNQFTVKLDGEVMSVVCGQRDGPSNFKNFTDKVLVGAANIRGEEVSNYFNGYISNVSIYTENVLLGNWTLVNGYGIVSKDSSGYRHDALLHCCRWDLSVPLPMKSVVFDGTSSYVALPHVSYLANHMHDFMVEFWMQTTNTNKQMSVLFVADVHREAFSMFGIMCNTTTGIREGKYEKGTTRFFMSDIKGATFEALSQWNIYNGEWNHIQWRVKGGVAMELSVNDTLIPVTYGQRSFSLQYQPWKATVLLGAACLDEAIQHHFDGKICGLIFHHGESLNKSVVGAHYPLADVACNSNTAIDISSNARHGLTSNLKWLPLEGKMLVQCFDGVGTVMNCGNFSHWNLRRPSSIEIWFMSHHGSEQMTLLGLKEKQLSLYITLNKTFKNGDDGYTYEMGCIVFFLQDSEERQLIAEIQVRSLCNGEWHKLVVNVNGDHLLESNAVTMTYDDFEQDVDIVRNENPREWPEQWLQWLAVGALNDYGVTKEHLSGYLRSISISNGSEKRFKQIAWWVLNSFVQTPLIRDCTDSNQHATVINGSWQPSSVLPHTFLHFNGTSSCMLIGTLENFGCDVPRSAVDFWIKTDTTRKGALLSTLNSSGESIYGIFLNSSHQGTDPKEATYQHRLGWTAFKVVDSNGCHLEASICTMNLYDNNWHHVIWKIVSAPNNMMAVFVDGESQVLHYGRQDAPSNYVPWTQMASVGASYNEGEYNNHAKFCLADLRLWTYDNTLYAHWALNDCQPEHTLDCSGLDRKAVLFKTTWAPILKPPPRTVQTVWNRVPKGITSTPNSRPQSAIGNH